MEKDSQTWLSTKNNDSEIEKLLIPDVSYKQTDYFIKLQNKATLVEQGEFEDYDGHHLDTVVMEYKNSKLIPIYKKFKTLAKYFKATEITQLIKEYETARVGLKNNKKLSAKEI